MKIIIEIRNDEDELIVKGSGYSFESAEEELGRLERYYKVKVEEEKFKKFLSVKNVKIGKIK